MEAVTARLNLNYYFMNCYKKIINNMADYKDAWTGTDAKWIDECAAPFNQPIIKVFENDFTEGVTETAIFGGTTINQAGCFKYGNWAAWAPYLLGVGRYVLKQFDLDTDYKGNSHYSSKEYPLY